MKFRKKLGSVILASSLLMSTAMPHKSYASKGNTESKKERSLDSDIKEDLTEQGIVKESKGDEADAENSKIPGSNEITEDTENLKENTDISKEVSNKSDENDDKLNETPVNSEKDKAINGDIAEDETAEVEVEVPSSEEVKSENSVEESKPLLLNSLQTQPEEASEKEGTNIGDSKDSDVWAAYDADTKTVKVTGNGTVNKIAFQKFIGNYNNKDTKLVFGDDENRIKFPEDCSGFFHSVQTNIVFENVDTSNVKSMAYMFAYLSNANPDVSNWDTSNVTDMNSLFFMAGKADPDLSNWDTSNVTDMSRMFYGAESATLDKNGGLKDWDTSNVTNMYLMFSGALVANPDVSEWNVGNVTNMSNMFGNTLKADPDVSKWDTSKVQNMSSMFNGAKAANPDVSKWNTDSVKDMSYMFRSAGKANPDVSRWNTSKVTNMAGMFAFAVSADPDVSKWDTSNVTDMSNMFNGANSANPDTSGWNTDKIKNMNSMFINNFKVLDLSSMKILDDTIQMSNFIVHSTSPETVIAKGDLLNLIMNKPDSCNLTQGSHIIYDITDPTNEKGIGMFNGRKIDLSNTDLSDTGFISEHKYKIVLVNRISLNFTGEGKADLSGSLNYKDNYYGESEKNITVICTDPQYKIDNITVESLKNMKSSVFSKSSEAEENSIKVENNTFVMPDKDVIVNVTFKKAEVKKFTVNFEMNGHGTAVSAQNIAKGDKAVEPAMPAEEGFIFAGWFTDRELTNAFDFSSEINSDLTLYAKWEENIKDQGTGEDNEQGNSGNNDTTENEDKNKEEGNNEDKNEGNSDEKDSSKDKDKGSKDRDKDDKKPEILTDSETIDIKKGNITADELFGKSNNLAYIFGYPDGTFRPDKNMTRAEVAAMFSRLMSNKTVNSSEIVSYSDVKKGDWYYDSVELLSSMGILKGYPDGTFRPDNNITRAEFSSIVSRFENLSGGESKFTDVNENNWAYKSIASAAEKGWMNGYPDGTFKPDNKITRAEAVKVTNNILNRHSESENKENSKFSDTKNHWAYDEIEEASGKNN